MGGTPPVSAQSGWRVPQGLEELPRRAGRVRRDGGEADRLLRGDGVGPQRSDELGLAPAGLADPVERQAGLGRLLDEGGGFRRAGLDEDGVGLQVGDPLGLRPVRGLLGWDDDAVQDVDAQELGSLLLGICRQLEARDVGVEDDDVLGADHVRVLGAVHAEALVETLGPEDGLCRLAAEVARDGATVDRRPERAVVLGPHLHHVVTVGPVLVGDAHQDLGAVLLDAGLGGLALEAVADVLGDQLPGAAERRIEVDDLVDRRSARRW